MTKKRKIILISLAVTLALAVGVGGFVYANENGDHDDVGGNKLIGVGEMGYDTYSVGGIDLVSTTSGGFDQDQWWDTQFIITNPNCDKPLTIKWVALIASDETPMLEGPPDMFGIPSTLSGHRIFQVSIAELMDLDPDAILLDKYTLEVTWSGAHYRGWWWWGYWRSGRPLTGWQKEKCWYVNYGGYANTTVGFPDGPINYDLVVNNAYIYSDSGMAISEAEMELFPSRRPFIGADPS